MKTQTVIFHEEHFARLSDVSDTTYLAGQPYVLPAPLARRFIGEGVAAAMQPPRRQRQARAKKV